LKKVFIFVLILIKYKVLVLVFVLKVEKVFTSFLVLKKSLVHITGIKKT